MLTVHSVELLFSAIINKRQFNLASQIWDSCSYDSQRRWGIWSTYCRCLLSDQQLEAARPLLNKLQMCSYSIPSANRSVIQGLYTGKYYEECLRFFNGLLQLDSKGLLLGDALSFQLALKSAYQLRDYRQVMSIYDRMVKSNLSASRPVVYIVASVALFQIAMTNRCMNRESSGKSTMKIRSVYYGILVLFQRRNSEKGMNV